MSRSLKKLIMLTGAIALLAAACNKQVAVQPAQNQTQTASTEDRSTWKTYTNSKFKYEFQYPQNVEVKEETGLEGEPEVDVKPDSEMVSVKMNSESSFGVEKSNLTNFSKVAIDQQIKTEQNYGAPKYSDYTITSTTIARQPALELSYNKSYTDIISDFYYVNHSGTILLLTVVKNNPVATQIFSTFKFTDSASTAGLKIYSNNQYGYTFSYPENWVVENDPQFLNVNNYLTIDLACIYATEGVVNPIIEKSTVKYGTKTYKEEKTYDKDDGKRLVFDFVTFDLPTWYQNQPINNTKYFKDCPAGTFIISPTSNRAEVDKIISTFNFTK